MVKLQTHIAARANRAHLQLEAEIHRAADRIANLDQGPNDLNSIKDQVHRRSPKGRVEEHGSLRYNTQAPELEHAIYKKTEFGAKGQPIRSTTLSYNSYGMGNLLSKTVVDRNGTTIITGGSNRYYHEHKLPGSTIDSLV